jgi:hypothetical protein
MTSGSSLSLSLMSTVSANPALAIIVPTTLAPGVANATLANAAAAAPAIARDVMYLFTITAEPSRLMLMNFLLGGTAYEASVPKTFVTAFAGPAVFGEVVEDRGVSQIERSRKRPVARKRGYHLKGAPSDRHPPRHDPSGGQARTNV